jgi:hypothetical protein
MLWCCYFGTVGWAVSAFFGYLKGVSNELALKHVPHIVPRNDTLAGPLGRRGDQVWYRAPLLKIVQAGLSRLPGVNMNRDLRAGGRVHNDEDGGLEGGFASLGEVH